MNITIAGGSGFLGRALMARLKADGHRVRGLTRTPKPGHTDHVAWNPDGSAGAWFAAIDGVDAVVNLAGEGIADRRWNDRRKRALLESRVLSTRSLASAIARAA